MEKPSHDRQAAEIGLTAARSAAPASGLAPASCRAGIRSYAKSQSRVKNAEGVGERSEARTQAAVGPPVARRGISPPSVPSARPTRGRTSGCSNLGLADALYLDRPAFPCRDREAIARATKLDQSTKSSTRRRRLPGDELTLRLPLRLLRGFLLRFCLLSHNALLAKVLASSMKCTCDAPVHTS